MLSGVAYRQAAPDWPLASVIVHAAFALIAITALLTLGRSFAVLPGRRAIVVRGPYRLVRNPIYLGELGMITTACATRGWPDALGALALGALLLIPRIVLEERALAADPAYEEYRAAVRHRLLPGVF
jgi:protein-S-isoprenylcysteine O-methyltransferase Ste14